MQILPIYLLICNNEKVGESSRGKTCVLNDNGQIKGK